MDPAKSIVIWLVVIIINNNENNNNSMQYSSLASRWQQMLQKEKRWNDPSILIGWTAGDRQKHGVFQGDARCGGCGSFLEECRITGERCGQQRGREALLCVRDLINAHCACRRSGRTSTLCGTWWRRSGISRPGGDWQCCPMSLCSENPHLRASSWVSWLVRGRERRASVVLQEKGIW